MIRTYVDAGILIMAARGKAPSALAALAILDDPGREFVSSIFTKLEVLPKAVWYRNESEADFYIAFFSSVIAWPDSLDAVFEEAFKEACDLGLAALDALHVASALATNADELVTTERTVKPIHRTRSIRVISIHD